MANAEIKLLDGTEIKIDGTPNEIYDFVEKYKKKQKKNDQPIKIKEGPTSRICQLIDDGFFMEKRTSSHVKEQLEQNGYIYPIESISTPLRRLKEQRKLRKIKEGKNNYYVNP